MEANIRAGTTTQRHINDGIGLMQTAERSAVVGLKTPDAILVLLTDNPHLTRVQLASIIGRDVRTIARALAKRWVRPRLACSSSRRLCALVVGFAWV